MAGKVSSRFAILLFVLALAAPLQAQKMGEYSFSPSSDGAPIFTQVLRWTGDENVLYYEFTLQTAAGETLSVLKLEEPLVKLKLRPGEYRYKIAVYNLLGKIDEELPWRSLTVLEAELPRITDVAPNAWFLEDLVSEVTLSGENLAPGATIELRPATGSGTPIVGKETAREGKTKVSIAFPAFGLAAGKYSLTITNPGGLSFAVNDAISVRYERSMDMLVSVGYAPWISLYDSWYTEAWSGPFFPVGFISRLSVYFLKRPYGHFGAELSIAGRSMEGGSEDAAVKSLTGLIGVNGIFRHPYSKKLAVALRTGGGITISHHAFVYAGSSGSELNSLDPYVNLGVSFQYFPVKRFFLEAGTDWEHVFAVGFMEGGVMPFIAAGMLL
jgi:hypothetical protein